MKITKTLQRIVKEDGKNSPTARIIIKYQKSKEFSYLVDINR